MDSERATILVNYRERITKGARTKLTTAETATLIGTFIADLKGMRGLEVIQDRCNQEISLLEEGYPRVTIASRILAGYRAAIRESVEAGDLPLDNDTSYPQDGTREHAALVHLKYSREVYTDLRQDTLHTNNARQDTLQPIVVDAYLEAIDSMLFDSSDPHTLTAAIAAATGRRHTEVLSRGKFEATTHPYMLRFEGQQKKRGDQAGPFDILTLVPAHTILISLQQLRQHPTVVELAQIDDVNDPAIRAYNSQVNRVVKKRFEDSGLVPVVAGAESVSIHRLRGVYGAIAVYLWCPPHQHETRFLQHYLGHEENSPATAHYQHYRLIDSAGGEVHGKGTLRAQFPLPDPTAPETPQPAAPAAPQPAAPAAPQPADTRPTGIDAITLPALLQQAQALAFMTTEIESLRRQIVTLQQDAAQARDWSAERSIYQAKIDSLEGENKTLRRRLERFEGIRAFFAGDEPIAPEAPAAPQDAPAAPQQPTAAPAAPQQPTAAPATPQQPTAPTGRRSSAEDRAARVWTTIQQWNNSPDRPLSHKIVLSNTLLEREFGIYRPAIKRFMEGHASEIATHHEQHGLTNRPTQNRDLPPNVLDTIKQLVAA